MENHVVGSSAPEEKEGKSKASLGGANGFCSSPRDLLLHPTSHHYSSAVLCRHVFRVSMYNIYIIY